jgi:hypothetical protein
LLSMNISLKATSAVLRCGLALGAHKGITGKTGANPARSRHCE